MAVSAEICGDDRGVASNFSRCAFRNLCSAIEDCDAIEAYLAAGRDEMSYETGLDRKSFGATRDQREDHHRHRTPNWRKNSCYVRALDDGKVILRDQVVEFRNVDGRLHVARKECFHDEWDPFVPSYDPYGLGDRVTDDAIAD